MLDQADQRLGAEYPDEQIDDVEDERENGQAGQRLPDRAAQEHLNAADRGRPGPSQAGSRLVCPRRVIARSVERDARGRCRQQGHPEVVQALPVDRHRLDHGNAEFGRKPCRVDIDAVAPRLVHHIEHENHRQAESGDLRGEHQRPAQVARVGHLDDDVGLAAGEETASDLFVLAQLPLEGVDPGAVDDVADLGADEGATGGQADGGAGVVRNRGVAAGQTAEDDALADIRVADEDDLERARPEREHGRRGGALGSFGGNVTGHRMGDGARTKLRPL